MSDIYTTEEFKLIPSNQVPLWYADYSSYNFDDGTPALIGGVLNTLHIIDDRYYLKVIVGYISKKYVIELEIHDKDYDYYKSYVLRANEKASLLSSADDLVEYINSKDTTLKELQLYLLSSNYERVD